MGECPGISGTLVEWRWPSVPSDVDLTIVVPAFDESVRLPRLLDGLAAHCPLHATEIIVVDDGSTDGTADVARRWLRPFPRAQVLRIDHNAGKGAAVRAGIGRARGRMVMFMDADMATELDDMGPLLAALESAGIAVGSRTAPGAHLDEPQRLRRAMRATFNRLVRASTRVEISDTQCGFKAFHAASARLLYGLSELDGFGQDVEILDLASRLGVRVAEVPVRWHAVPGSKVRPLRHSVHLAAALVKLGRGPRSRRPVPVISFEPGSTTRTGLALVDALDAILVRPAPVLVTGEGVHVLLPRPDDGEAQLLVGALADLAQEPASVSTFDVALASLVSRIETLPGRAAAGWR